MQGGLGRRILLLPFLRPLPRRGAAAEIPEGVFAGGHHLMSRNTILLVLKDKSETDSLSGGLKAAGFEIQSAADGAEALDKAIVEGPSLIISDTELPSLDGERLFRIVRGNLSPSRIPFIIVTDKVLELKGFMSGLDIFLTRPFDPEEVLLIASRALMRKESPAVEGKVINGDLMHMPLAHRLYKERGGL